MSENANACQFCDRKHSPPQPCAPRDMLRNGLAVDLHRIFCNSASCDNEDSCWTEWRGEANQLMIRVEEALAHAWAEGARSGARGFAERRKRNPYRRGEVS